MLSIAIVSFSQINSANLNKAQKSVSIENLSSAKVIGYIEYKYSDKKMLEKNKPNHYSVIFIDSVGKTLKTIEFDESKKRGGYSIYEYNNLNQLSKKYNYKSDNSIFWINEDLYDITGELIESVQIGESGTINSKTINHYNNGGYLTSAEVIGPDGNLTFNKSIKLNGIGLPISIETKHTRGFTMSTSVFKYNENNLPSEKTMTIGMTGKTSKFTYEYNDDNLLSKQQSYKEGELKSIQVTRYFTSDFFTYLKNNGFEYEGLKEIDKAPSNNKYFFKSLAQYSGGEKPLEKYLKENIVYATSLKDKGVVMVGFAVETDGSITDIEVHRSVSKKSDKKAIKIVKGMPNWIPAEKTDGSLYKSTVSVAVPFI